MWNQEKAINFNKSKHATLQHLARIRLDYVRDYHDPREGMFSKDQIVDNLNLSYDNINIILSSLLANEEIKIYNFENDNEYSGYVITNRGMHSFEDEKYLRLNTDRTRAKWGYIFSILSIIISIIALCFSAL